MSSDHEHENLHFAGKWTLASAIGQLLDQLHGSTKTLFLQCKQMARSTVPGIVYKCYASCTNRS